ncbi:unnamed protein product, partial [Meganyctiphanes norvegica]
WADSDIEGVSLTLNDRSHPYPYTVSRCLANKLRNAKDLKKEALELVSEKRRLLESKHGSCHSQSRRDLNVVFKATKDIIGKFGEAREREIVEEIRELIRVSAWQKLVKPSKVRNLTTNEVNTTELELLSLGIDFKLQTGNSSLVELSVAFQQFKYKYQYEVGYPDLHFAKTHLISKISKDNSQILPKRYNNAIKSLKGNNNIMVLQS